MKLGLNSISVWFGMIMILLVLAGAIAFSFTDFMDDRLFGTKRFFFVLLLIAYAVYRGFRLYQIFKRSDYED
jgi:hypothetical protein